MVIYLLINFHFQNFNPFSFFFCVFALVFFFILPYYSLFLLQTYGIRIIFVFGFLVLFFLFFCYHTFIRFVFCSRFNWFGFYFCPLSKSFSLEMYMFIKLTRFLPVYFFIHRCNCFYFIQCIDVYFCLIFVSAFCVLLHCILWFFCKYLLIYSLHLLRFILIIEFGSNVQMRCINVQDKCPS